jgi:thioester reductase-like protein
MENDQQVIIISAKCKESLKEYIRDITVFINNNDSINLQELAYTLQVGREEMNERIAIVVSGFEELRNILSKYIQDEEHINNLYVGTSKKDKSNLVNTGEINRLIINRKLQEIAQKWVCGEETDWKLLHNNKKIKRISLPSYSFLKNRHWIEKSKNKKHEESELNKNDNVDIINIDNNTINFDIKDLSKKFEEDLIKIVAIVLKMNEHEIDLDMEFSEFGFDSITFVEFSNLLNDKYKLNIIASTFYEHSILLSLLEYLMEEYENDLTSYYKDSLKKINNHIVTDNNSESKNQETSISNIPTDDIAIIGLNGRYPMANNLLELWDNFVNAKDCVAEIPIKRWDYNKYYDPDKQKLGKSNCKWGGFLEDIESFDPLFFNISPIEARFMDPQERMFLETVHHTLEDSGYSRTRIEKSKVGVFVGVMYGEYQLYGVEEDLKGNPLSLGSSYASIANRVSYFYNLKGPSIALDTMCSSALTAVHLACESIYRGESEMAIAGGVNASLHPNKYLMLTQNGLASSDGKCHSFGDGGDGYVPGEGAGAILLKPLKKAKEDGDYIHGVIKGISINHGGRSNGYIVPNGTSQAEVITETIEKSEVNPRAINYIEGQGTGTPLGDSIEISSLSKAFKKYTKEKKYCPIGSAKSNIGHLESAGGIVAITKVLLQMKYKKIVPSLHSEKLNPNINFEETPFYIQHELTEWEQPVIDGEKHPRCAGINAFGAGGTNVHMIIEEYENEQLNYNIDKEEGTLVTVSARNKDRLKVYAKDLYKHLENNEEDIPVNNIAYTLQLGREAMEERLAVNVSNTKELIERLKEYCNGTKSKKIYIGNSKKNKLQLKNMLYGKEKEEYINELIVNKDLDMLAQLWALGANINWDLFYKSIKYSLVSLPLYPFDKKSYWVPKAKGGNKVENIVENVVQIEELQNKKVENVNQIEESVHVKLDEDLFQRVLKNIINCTCEILGIDEGDIDSDIELVEYGMNSILMVRLANIIKEEYDNLTSFGMLFQEATLSSMAKHITENILLSEATKKPKTTRAKQSEVKSKRIVDNSRIDIVDGTSLITNNILINGVTGLLGGRTLKEYLETTNSTLYCLVRGENKDKARERILNMLSTYGLDETIKLKFEQRVVPVIGDITKHKLGLDEEEYNNLTNTIDMVVHIAGKISLHGFYEEVKPVNVDGTRNMIDFALKTKQKYFIHTSTIAIMGDCLLKNCPPYTEDDFYIGQEFENMGYEQSKFEAEEMVRASSKDGLKWIVVRSGYIMGDSKNGFYPFGITSVPGVFYDYIKTAIEMKTFFNSPLYFDVTPVDYISRAIVHFSTQNKNIYEIYHLCNPNPCTLNDIINCVIKYGYKIDIVNFNRFLNKIKNKDNSYRSMATELTLLNYSDDSYGYSSVDATYTKEILEEVGIICPKVDEKLIKIYLDHCIEVGYLKEPKRKTIKEKVK